MRRAVTALHAVSGWVAAAPAIYLAGLSLAALGYRPRSEGSRALSTRLVVVVPAHDEEVLLGRCLASLFAQDYDRELFRVVVVADNCEDTTATVAEGMGAEVLVRTAPHAPGKGQALRWAFDRLSGSSTPVDAFVVVDADSVADSGLLRGLVQQFEAGAPVVQGEYLALEAEEDAADARSLAFLLFHGARFRGRSRLGLPVALVGNGMLIGASVLQAVPWAAYSQVEDLEYTLDLRVRGIAPAFAAGAQVRAPVDSSGPAARTQRLRWEGGRLQAVRRQLPGLLRALATGRRWDLWDAAVDLAVPPVGVVAITSAAGLLSGAVLRWRRPPSLVGSGWALACGGLAVHVVAGLAAVDASPRHYRSLTDAPGLVARDTVNRLGLARHLRRAGWERTARPGEAPGRPRGPSPRTALR